MRDYSINSLKGYAEREKYDFGEQRDYYKKSVTQVEFYLDVIARIGEETKAS